MRETLMVTAKHGIRPLQAHCHLARSKFYRRSDHQGEARYELMLAIVILRETGLTLWISEAEAELAKMTLLPTVS